MAKINIEKAHGVALDWLVAAALGFEPEREGTGMTNKVALS